ncbi:MAG: CRISPR-associated endoribonuclease Cas6 [candidate division WOR-3 bacterium]
MRIRINFLPENSLFKIPVNYNYLIQSFIYRNISKNLSDFLHGKGYSLGKRTFKMFTFSRISGKSIYEKETKTLIFKDNFEFWVSSPLSDFLESYATELLKKPELWIGEQRVYVHSIEIGITPTFGEEITVKMLSPITVYRTLEDKIGKKKTYYFHPRESEFSELVSENIKRKYKALYKCQPPSQEFKIIPEKLSKNSEQITYYKNKYVIKGWLGVYTLKSHPEMLKLAWNAGIGAKNSEGFGMFEILNLHGKEGSKSE